jgi:hypothetical protein
MADLRAIGLTLVLAALAVPGAARAAPPTNDAFAAAEELSGRVSEASGITKDATKEIGEPDHAHRSGGASVWYRWTAPAAGRAVVSTCGSSFDTVLAAYTGETVAALTEIAGNDDACELQSRVSFAAAAGVIYRIAVDGINGATGALALSIRLAPANDDFADAVPLPGDEGSIEGTNVGAAPEDAEPDYLNETVWYRWTAPSSGPTTFETCGSAFDTILAAYTGDALETLTLLRYSDDACGLSSRITLDAQEGLTYHIVVDGYSDSGDFILRWNRNPPPAEPPEPDVWPTVSGNAREGEILAGSAGEWLGSPPFTFTYAWVRCDARYAECRFVPGASAETYTLTTADIGYRLYLLVNAHNAAGVASARSEATEPVRAAGPLNAAPPQVIGDARVGETLTASEGTWSGVAPIQHAYQWQACDPAGAACSDLDGERLRFIELRAAHLGRRLRVVVSASNLDGSRSAASDASPVVVARPITRVARCLVPNLRGRSLSQARAAIRRSLCATGAVRRAYSRSVRRGRVMAQTPRAGARLRRGAKVNLVISRGRKP